ncbi:MAG: glycosyltransferase family 9 protein [Pyrinomonas methylaliphatogenes]|nr:glycosyltransferase family 9 protein [Pyrinomonas methylaliphatogenes]
MQPTTCGQIVPEGAQPLGPARWDWSEVRRVLVVRLRSIGDAVLATPALHALRRFLPEAEIDVLLEDWVAPLFDGCTDATRVISIAPTSTARMLAVKSLRASNYDVAFNLHGGTTATLLTWASGARHRVGFASYQYARLHNHLAPHPSEIWRQDRTHSAEQQLALLGWTGVPVTDRPRARLMVTQKADEALMRKLRTEGLRASQPFVLMHPAAAFESKMWAAEKFARVADGLRARGLMTIIVAAPAEEDVVRDVVARAHARIIPFTTLSLPEVAALARRAKLFIGNDSGIAHIAAAVGTPAVVIFGSSNVAHWRPWTDAPHEVVRVEMDCAPCPGYTCAVFDRPECIRRVSVESVIAAIDRLLGRI